MKTVGYASSVSMIILGIVSWRTAAKDPALAVCLTGGLLASVVGMMLRWISYQCEDQS